ncbi:MAG TPA: hypothetical protein EYP16_03865 [Candidatus Atribacteria bacterium]|nr:hypothetical protein [Candidatus Atribacteria bacterium]
MADIMEILSEKKISATSVKVNTEAGMAYMELSFMVESLKKLKTVIAEIKKVRGVQKIYRTKNLYLKS